MLSTHTATASLQEHGELDEKRVASRVPTVREHFVPELQGRADVFGVLLLLLLLGRWRAAGAAAAYVVPDAGHDVLGRSVRLVEHAEPEPVGERPPKPGVVLAGRRYDGHADGSGHQVRVDGQRDPVTSGRHVKRRAARVAVRER